MRPVGYWHYGAHICEAVKQVIQNQCCSKFRIVCLEGRRNHWQSTIFPNVTTVQVTWSGLQAPPASLPPPILTDEMKQGPIPAVPDLQPPGEVVAREGGSLCSPGVWKGLQEVSDVALIVKGRQTGWWAQWEAYSFPPIPAVTWFQQKPWLPYLQS